MTTTTCTTVYTSRDGRGAGETTGPPDRLKFNLGGAFSKPTSNVLADAKLLPADANTAVVASFCIDHEKAPLLPQQRALV